MRQEDLEELIREFQTLSNDSRYPITAHFVEKFFTYAEERTMQGWFHGVPKTSGRYWAWCVHDGDMMPVNVQDKMDMTIISNDGAQALIVCGKPGSGVPEYDCEVIFSHFHRWTDAKPDPPKRIMAIRWNGAWGFTLRFKDEMELNLDPTQLRKLIGDKHYKEIAGKVSCNMKWVERDRTWGSML